MRRVLKQIVKEAQKVYARAPHGQKSLDAADYIETALRPFGLYASFANLVQALAVRRPDGSEIPGHTFTKLGRAAALRGKRVGVGTIARYAQEGRDLRTILYF